jgi:hypothetical protein
LDNDIPDIIEIDSDNENEIKKLFECEVCYKKFNDEDICKRHTRSHGLHFLRSDSYLNYFNCEGFKSPKSVLKKL